MAGLDPAICGQLAKRAREKSNLLMGGWVYMMTNRRGGALYIGVTGNLPRRVWERREGVSEGFTHRYGLTILAWAEHHDGILSAIQREKNIKHWPRAWKVALIEAQNPEWEDLYEQIVGL